MAIRTASYAYIIAILKGVAEGLIKDVKFITATWDQLSDETLNTTEQVLIGLEQGFQLNRRTPDDNTESGTIIIDIGLQDNYESDSTGQYNILASADIIANKYIEELAANSAAYGVQFSNIVKIPYYKKWGRLITGIGIQMDVQVNTCQPYEWSDVSEFAGAISVNVSPFDWSNYSDA